MDRKTLEYMEERAKKAREIVTKIEELSKDIQDVDGADEFIFQGIRQNVYIKVKTNWLVEQVRLTFIEATTTQIKRLEQELAEL